MDTTNATVTGRNGKADTLPTEEQSKAPAARSSAATLLAEMATIAGKGSASFRKKHADGTTITVAVKGNTSEATVDSAIEVAKALGAGDVTIRTPKEVNGFEGSNKKTTNSDGLAKMVAKAKATA